MVEKGICDLHWVSRGLPLIECAKKEEDNGYREDAEEGSCLIHLRGCLAKMGKRLGMEGYGY